jgi:hypothetical protein
VYRKPEREEEEDEEREDIIPEVLDAVETDITTRRPTKAAIAPSDWLGP